MYAITHWTAIFFFFFPFFFCLGQNYYDLSLYRIANSSYEFEQFYHAFAILLDENITGFLRKDNRGKETRQFTGA